MATIRIVIDDLNNGIKRSIDVPDDAEASMLVSAWVAQFKLPARSGKTVHRYKLIHLRDGRILKDTDTIKSVGGTADEAFALVTEAQIEEYLKDLQRDNIFRIPSLWEILFGLVAGIFFITFNFPKGVTNLGNRLGWSLVREDGATAYSILTRLFGSSSSAQTASFNNLWLGLLAALSIYLLALVSLSLKHRRFNLFGLGLLFLLVGTVCFHLLAWLVYLLIWLVIIIFIVLAWVFRVVGIALVWLLGFLGFLLRGVWVFLVNALEFLFGAGWWLLALILAILVISLAVKYRTRLLKAIPQVLLTGGILALIGGVGFLLFKLFQFLWPYIEQIVKAIGQFLAPIFAFFGHLWEVIFPYLRYVFIGLLVGVVVYELGSLFLDQFKGAWSAGSGRRGVILGALSIGTSVAFILLESNLGNVNHFYPGDFPHFVAEYLYQANPLFSIVVTLLIVAVSIVGLLRNFPTLRRGPALRQFQIAMGMVIPVLLLGLVLVVVSRQTEES